VDTPSSIPYLDDRADRSDAALHLRPRKPRRQRRSTRRRRGRRRLLGLAVVACIIAVATWIVIDDDTSPFEQAAGPEAALPAPAGPSPSPEAATATPAVATETASATAAVMALPAVPVSGGAALTRAENAKPGNPEWKVPPTETGVPGAEGFADRVSGQRGDTVRLFITSRAPTYQAIAYRLGYYGGAGARQIWASGVRPGIVQPPCPVNPAVLMVDCSIWAPSLSLAIGEAWPSGQYLFKLVPSDGTASSYVPFVVRDDGRHSDVLVVSSVTTLQAYNPWGGHSYYSVAAGQSAIVSYDRPLDIQWMRSQVYGDTHNVAQMVESLGLDVTYTTGVDEHEHPELLRNHRVVISGFHDEYNSPEMRGGLEAARDSGVNLLFLGANAVYRRIRFEPSILGPSRHQVSYLYAQNDPLNGVDPEHVTTLWRDPPVVRPESALVGTSYECDEPGLRADMVILDGTAWMFAGTNVVSGQAWPGVVMQEYDRILPGAPTPPNIQVLAHSPLVCDGGPSWSDMTYYTAPSGAGVLSVGTVGFEPRLGPLCGPADLTAANWPCQLRQMMGNVMTEFAKGPAGLDHPAAPNGQRLGLIP
jgi:hypothetical protein